MQLQIKKVGERPIQINAIVFGNPGSGKTVLAGTASDVPEMSPVLFADIDKGLDSLDDRPDIDCIEIDRGSPTSSMKALHRYLTAGEGKGRYKTIVIDSLSEWLEVELGRAAAEQGRDSNEVQDYNPVYQRVTRAIQMFCDAPGLNVIALAHTRLERGRVDTRKQSALEAPILAAFPKVGSFNNANKLMGAFDAVWLMTIAKDGHTRVLHPHQSGVIMAKTRGMKVSKLMGTEPLPNPTFSMIYNFYKQARKENKGQ